jgi:CheY-like chemotaxis protein
MEAVGRLAGGVAHDFNNVLTAIVGYVELLLNEPQQEKTRNGLREMQRAAVRASGLTRQLLAFSRQQMLQPTIVDLNDVVRQLHNLLRPLIGENVDLVMELEPTLASTRADVGQLEQVIVNLAVNARDAMPSGGTITLSTATVELDHAGAARLRPMSPGRYTRLTVRDTGTGMDAVTQAKIFEPFFTTKPRGKGTGLGLSTVYGIVKQSGGFIWVNSRPGNGTAFDIYLPAVAGAVAAPERPADDVAVPSRCSGETVLLLEDEDGVRQLLATVLTTAGYKVIAAPSAEAGLDIALRSPHPIDILLTDIVMTGQNGVTAARQFLGAWPGARVIFMSGYPDEMLIRELETIPNATFIGKPFTPRELHTAMYSSREK